MTARNYDVERLMRVREAIARISKSKRNYQEIDEAMDVDDVDKVIDWYEGRIDALRFLLTNIVALRDDLETTNEGDYIYLVQTAISLAENALNEDE